VFELLTDDARRVIVDAQEEARSAHHPYIGTEHLLLGVIRQRNSIAGHTLESLGITLEPTRAMIRELVGVGTSYTGHIPFSPRAKQLLEEMAPWADQDGKRSVGPEQILIALLRDSQVAAILRALNVTPEDASNALTDALQAMPDYGAATSTVDPSEDRLKESSDRFDLLIQQKLDGLQERSNYIVQQKLDELEIRANEIIQQKLDELQDRGNN